MATKDDAKGIIREVPRKWFRALIRTSTEMVFNQDYETSTTKAKRLRSSMDVRLPKPEEYMVLGHHKSDGDTHHKSDGGNSRHGETLTRRWLGVSHRVGGLMSHLTQKGTAMSRTTTTVQRVTNLEKQTEECKSASDEFGNDIRRHSKEDYENGLEASKPNRKVWSECMEFDADFQEEFNQTMNDPKVLEADMGFTDVFNDRTARGETSASAVPECMRGTKDACLLALPRTCFHR
jgi:hypothetical protein